MGLLLSRPGRRAVGLRRPLHLLHVHLLLLLEVLLLHVHGLLLLPFLHLPHGLLVSLLPLQFFMFPRLLLLKLQVFLVLPGIQLFLLPLILLVESRRAGVHGGVGVRRQLAGVGRTGDTVGRWMIGCAGFPGGYDRLGLELSRPLSGSDRRLAVVYRSP